MRWTFLDGKWVRKKGGWIDSYQRKLHLASLLISPPFSISLTPPLYLAFPFWLLNRALMNPLPTDPPPATVSQRCLCPSPALLGRRFLPRPRGTRHILLQPAQEKEKRTVTRYEWNQICLTCLAAMTAFHAGRECQDWVNGMKLLAECLTDLLDLSVLKVGWKNKWRVISFPAAETHPPPRCLILLDHLSLANFWNSLLTFHPPPVSGCSCCTFISMGNLPPGSKRVSSSEELFMAFPYFPSVLYLAKCVQQIERRVRHRGEEHAHCEAALTCLN